MRFPLSAFLLATVAGSAMLAPQAQAQVTDIPAPAINDGEAALHGVGATSIENVLVQELNCIAKHNPLGTFQGGLKVLPEPTNLPSAFDCSLDPTDSAAALEPNFNAKYLATGSGSGRGAWNSNSNIFGLGNPLGTWTQVQFAFSDSPLKQTELDIYNSAVAPSSGPAVQFPQYVLPIAIAYNPQYGVRADATPLNFNIVNPKTILGVAAGGLQLNAQTYCRIFNGDIVNWNDAEITADNGGTSLRSFNDDLTRWTNEGVPIRIVGRVDRSGETNIFTRHLAAVCGGKTVTINKFGTSAETLPYDTSNSNLPDFTSVRADSGLRFNSGQPTAGTINSVSSTYWNHNTKQFDNVTNGTRADRAMLNGTKLNGAGLFIVAIGSDAVAEAINYAPSGGDVVSRLAAGTRLNGKLGYIGADFVPPAPLANGLHAAALKNTAGASSTFTDYRMPSAEQGALAASTTRAPQTTSAGAYDPTDDGRGLLRSNPINWYDAIYSPTATLANPPQGYPITGTTQFLGYTCYKAGNLENIQNFVGWNTGYVNVDHNFVDRADVFLGATSAVATSGLLTRSNIGAMPPNWRTAITETFLSDPNGLGLAFGNATACSGKTGR